MLNITKYLLLLLLVKKTVSIVLKHGGYEDVYIYVQDTNEESEYLLKRIQEVFTEASKFMFSATRQRIYFKNIRIVIPRSWSMEKEYKNMPVPSLKKQYIVVDKKRSTPHVAGLGKCGGEGKYMYLNADDFLLQEGRTNWGLHDHVIVHEWGHLRWGLFDEYPVTKQKYPSFYQADGKWKHVSCIENIKGRAGIGSQCKADDRCNTDDTRKVMSKHCKFCRYYDQSIMASLMGSAYLKPMSMFCDKDDISVDERQRHNSRAPSKHNKLCEHRSAWEVMRMHKDFQGDNTLLSSTNTAPQFEIVQDSGSYRIFVLDVSGSMANEKLVTLRQTGKFVIQEVIMQSSWLGIVTFNNSASMVKELTQINSQSDRDALIDALPTSVSGGTCIGCGIEEAIRILKLKLGSAKNAEIVVISDGSNNQGDMQSSTRIAVQEKVIVHTIAVTQKADSVLDDIAEETEGKHYAYFQLGSISFAAAFSETIMDDPTSAKSQHVMLLSEKIDSTLSDLLRFSFSIEDGIGSNTSVTVIKKSNEDMNIELIGPNNFLETLNTNETYATLLIPGIAMAGQYEVKISMQAAQQAIEYYVKSTPTSEDIVTITSWLSSSHTDFLTDELPAVFVDVRKGYVPVINANVTARAESDDSSCKLALADNGEDPDIVLNDGVYSGYVMPHCLRSGRVNVKAYVWGQAGEASISKNVFGAPAIEEVDEDLEIFDESFQRVQVLEELHVTNYSDPGTKDITSPRRITDVNIYNAVSGNTQNGENRNLTITWTAPGDDKNIGQASAYILRISDDLETLLHDFDSADLLEMGNATLIPQGPGTIEAIKIIVDAKQAYTNTAFFAVKAVDEAGNAGKVSNVISIVVANGYRASVEKGSLETVNFPETVEDVVYTFVIIIIATVGGVVLLMICLLVLYVCRKQRIQKRKDGDVRLGRF